MELIETLPYAEILDEPNATTKLAMNDAIAGKVKKHKNAKQLLAFLNK